MTREEPGCRFTVRHQPTAPEEFKFILEPHHEAGKAALDAMRHWTPEQLVPFALNRRGYSTDGYFGVSYPDNLDGSDLPLAKGHVRVYAGYGDPHSPDFDLPESDYLAILCQFLRLQGREDLAARLGG